MEELQNKKRKNRFTLFIIVIFGILICFLSYNLWKGNEKIEILNIEIDNQQKKQEEKRLDEIDLRSNLDKLINDHQGERSSWGPGATRSGGHPPLLAGRFDDQFRKILIFSKK